MKKIICLTPVKNEAWILEEFLTAASLWADRIIVADQGSSDASRDIARRFEKVTLIDNTSEYDEAHRTSLLHEHARTIEGDKILIALDADEFLSANVLSSPEWQKLHELPIGTTVRFTRVNVRPAFKDYWILDAPLPFGFVDDNRSENKKQVIHAERLPIAPAPRQHVMQEVVILHLAYVDWERMQSRHRWYLCWETLHRRGVFRPVSLYRKYHHMYAVGKDRLMPLPSSWLAEYAALGLDLTQVRNTGDYWWDAAVLAYLKQFGAAHFKREAIWGIDWTEKARQLGLDRPEEYRDPRSVVDKAVQRWLRFSQPFRGRISWLDRTLNWLYRSPDTP